MIPSKRGLSKYFWVAATSCSKGVPACGAASMVVMDLRSSLSPVPLTRRVYLRFLRAKPQRRSWSHGERSDGGFDDRTTDGPRSGTKPVARQGDSGQPGCAGQAYALNRPANPRRGRSALVSSPGGASTTERIALRAGSPVTVMPIEAKLSGLDRSTPGFAKTMCLL